MGSLLRTVAPLLFAVALIAAFVHPAAAADLTLKRVLLSSGGVGYFEYEARVTGDTVLALDVPLEQVDDVLKSVIVFDDQGGVGGVKLPGREPLSEVFRNLPFGPDALESAATLFDVLKGAPVNVAGKRALTGKLIGIEQETVMLPDGVGTTTRHRVSLLTDSGVQQFLLEEQDSVRLADPALEAQVAAALDAVAQHRVRDRRTLEILARGSGERMVRVGYVVSAPLWKASYRLNLGATQTGLQGWAHLENLSGQDWNGVELTLVSGNPVTFRQALYSAYFVDRPEVPVEVMGRVLPPPDSGAIALEDERYQERVRGDVAMAEAGPRDYLAAKSATIGALDSSGVAGGEPEAPPPAPTRIAGGAIATAREEAATQVVMRLSEPVTLPSGQSLTVPVIDATVAAETIALYQPGVHGRHPLAAVRMTNGTGTGLPPGVLTFYDSRGSAVAYVGDARLAPMPANEQRLLSFALDQAILIDREDRSARTVVAGKITQGSLQLSLRESQTTLYRLKSSAAEARRVVIEHPRLSGWDLAPGHPNAELVEHAFRLPLDLAANAKLETEVSLERTIGQSYALIDMGVETLVYYAESGELDPKLRDAFTKLAVKRAEIDDLRRRLDRLEQEKARLFEDQSRLRENLSRVPSESDLHARYLTKLAAEETELDKLGLEAEATRDALVKAEAVYAEMIRTLEV